MDSKERNKFFWNSAARGGAITGAILSLGVVASYMAEDPSMEAWINNIAVFAGFVMYGYFNGRRFSRGWGSEALPFSKAFGFTFSTFLFAGIIYGAVLYLMYNYIDPQYYQQVFQTAINNTELSPQLREQLIAANALNVGNPIVMIFSSLFSMALLGLLPALILAAFMRRGPLPQETEEQ